MSTLICISHFSGRRITSRCQSDKAAVWIESGNDTIALTMTAEQRNELRAALDKADKIAARLEAVTKALADMDVEPPK